MSIKNVGSKIKGGSDTFTVLIIILVALASFGLGRLSKIESSKFPIKIYNNASVLQSTNQNLEEVGLPAQAGENTPLTVGKYVASKNGTKYHLPWCSGALRIKEENKIWFENKEEAENLGYEPAANCKGI